MREISAMGLNPGAKKIFDKMFHRILCRTDFLFAGLLLGEWAFAIFCSLAISPLAWEGGQSQVHIHVWAAALLGGAIVSAPVALGFFRPGETLTRHVIAVGQMLMSALLIHLTGGRIETHFHVFGSLAFLAFYRDWRVLVTATTIVAADHFLRGVFWPQSAFGAVSVSSWRWLEHAAWVLFEDVFLIWGCLQSLQEMGKIALREDKYLEMNEKVEETVRQRTKELEETQAKLVQSQKMEAVGQLSAGIAHDFNNVLGGIIAYASMLQADNQGNAALTGPLANIELAAARGADLVKKLLAFGRKGNYECVSIDLKRVLEETRQLLEPGFNRIVKFETKYQDEVWPIEGDFNQILQSMMNLGMNARDAMPSGGRLLFELRNLEPSAENPLRMVEILVSDTGVGISQENKAKIFDPFFTTKEVGKGTGLGLSMVYGIVQNHNGRIVVDSKEGHGTTFRILFPAAKPVAVLANETNPGVAVPPTLSIEEKVRKAGGTDLLRNKRVLLTDDDHILRGSIKIVLMRQGAQVIEATNGLEAVQIYKERWREIDSVILDVTMPEMDGTQAFLEMIKVNPMVHVVLASGYTESQRISDLRRQHAVQFIEKPFQLEQIVKELLTRVA